MFQPTSCDNPDGAVAAKVRFHCPVMCHVCTSTQTSTTTGTTTTSTSTSGTTTTGTGTTTTTSTSTSTSTTSLPCQTRLVAVIDRTISLALDEDGKLRADSCNVLHAVREVLSAVARQLRPVALSGTLELAVIAFDATAELLVDFDPSRSFWDTVAAIESADLQFRSGPTLAVSAFELARTELLQPLADADTTTVIAVFSDGSSLDQNRLIAELGRPAHAAVHTTRLMFDIGAVQLGSIAATPLSASPALFQLLAKPAVVGTQVLRLGCATQQADIVRTIVDAVTASECDPSARRIVLATPPPCTDNNEGAISALATIGYVVGGIGGCEQAVAATPVLCDDLNPTARALRFRELCAVSCNACPTPAPASPSTPQPSPEPIPTATDSGPATTAASDPAGGATAPPQAVLTAARATADRPAVGAPASVRASLLLELDNLAPSAAGGFEVTPSSGGGGGGSGLSIRMAGFGGLRVVKHPPALLPASPHTIAASFEQDPGTSGYIVAKTNAAGSVRHYALYSTAGRVTYYFQDPQTQAIGSVRFRVSVNDGRRHDLLLSIAADQYARLFVDGVSYRSATRVPNPTDCGPAGPDCVLYLGQRASASSASGGAWAFSGVLHSVFTASAFMENFPTPAIVDPASTAEISAVLHPVLAGARVTDWLDPATVLPATSIAGMVRRPELVAFAGTEGLRLRSEGLTTTRMAVAVDVLVTPRSSGYLFSKSLATGRTRYYALYVSAHNRDVVLYCSVRGADGQSRRRVVRFGIDLSDGRRYKVLLTVDSGIASLQVDGVKVGGTSARTALPHPHRRAPDAGCHALPAHALTHTARSLACCCSGSCCSRPRP